MKRIDAIATNNKIYYGSDIPRVFLAADAFVSPPATATAAPTRSTKSQ